jgi:hypothetical protein
LRLQGADSKECHLLGWDALWLLYEPTFWRNVSLIRVERIKELGMLAANVPNSLIPSILMMEARRSSETSVPTRATHHIPEDQKGLAKGLNPSLRLSELRLTEQTFLKEISCSEFVMSLIFVARVLIFIY